MRVRDVSVRVERVPHIPHGGRLLVEESPGEERVVWIREDQYDQETADLIAQRLSEADGLPDESRLEGCLFPS
jgi:hypothetical protein